MPESQSLFDYSSHAERQTISVHLVCLFLTNDSSALWTALDVAGKRCIYPSRMQPTLTTGQYCTPRWRLDSATLPDTGECKEPRQPGSPWPTLPHRVPGVHPPPAGVAWLLTGSTNRLACNHRLLFRLVVIALPSSLRLMLFLTIRGTHLLPTRHASFDTVPNCAPSRRAAGGPSPLSNCPQRRAHPHMSCLSQPVAEVSAASVMQPNLTETSPSEGTGRFAFPVATALPSHL